MADRTQPVHLYCGDDHAKGMQTAASAGAFNASDAQRPIMRQLQGGTADTTFKRPAPIVDSEWSLEHVLPQLANPGVTFSPLNVPVKAKATAQNSQPISALKAGGDIYTRIETIMDRVSVEPMFADLVPGTLFLINGLTTATVSATAQTVHWNVRRAFPGRFEREGFSIRIVPTFASAAARQNLVVQLGANYHVKLILSGGASALEVAVNSLTDTSSTFTHAGADELRIIVDWKRKRADVVRLSTLEVAASVALTRGDWSGREAIDAQFGLFDGTVDAPQMRPLYAAPRCDLMCIQMFPTVTDPVASASELVDALGALRVRPWGASAPIWLICPRAVDGQAWREAISRATAELQNVSMFETRHLARATVGAVTVLTGASLLTLSAALTFDAQVLFGAARRTMRRPRSAGYRRYRSSGDPTDVIQELLDAGRTTRELSPMLGGVGRRSGAGIDVPWPLMRTQRTLTDIHVDPNTGEKLVAFDRLDVEAGFAVEASDGCLLVPVNTGTNDTVAAAPDFDSAPLFNTSGASSSPVKTRAQLFDHILNRIERADGERGLIWPTVFGQTVWGSFDSNTQADPKGGSVGYLLGDVSAVATTQILGPAVTSVIGTPQWCFLWVKRNVSATVTGSFRAVDGAATPGLVFDPTTGRVAVLGSLTSYYACRMGEWFFLAFRYTPTTTTPQLGVQPAYGLVSGFPANDVAAVGTQQVWGGLQKPIDTSPLGEIVINPTPYMFTGTIRRTNNGALCCEGTRSNLITAGLKLDDAAWVTSNASVARYNGAGPDGSPEVWTVTDASASEGRIRYTTGVIGPGSNIVASIFVRRDASATAMAGLSVGDGTRTSTIQVNPATGAASVFSSGTPFTGQAGRADLITDEAGNEWYRMQLTVTTAAGVAHTVDFAPTQTTVLGTVNAATMGSTIAACAQLETGKFASTFIPSDGASLIRNADEHAITSADFFAGVGSAFYTDGFYLDYYPEHGSGTNSQEVAMILLHSSSGGVGAAPRIRLITASATQSQIETLLGASTHTSDSFTYAPGDRITIFMSFTNTELTYFLNGVQIGLADDISADGDFTGLTGDTFTLGATAFGSIPAMRFTG